MVSGIAVAVRKIRKKPADNEQQAVEKGILPDQELVEKGVLPDHEAVEKGVLPDREAVEKGVLPNRGDRPRRYVELPVPQVTP